MTNNNLVKTVESENEINVYRNMAVELQSKVEMLCKGFLINLSWIKRKIKLFHKRKNVWGRTVERSRIKNWKRCNWKRETSFASEKQIRWNRKFVKI